MMLAESLDSTAKIEHALSTLPSITPFGMSAILPLGDRQPDVTYSGNKLSIRLDGLELSTRDGRKAFLTRALTAPDGKSSVAFIDMEDLLQGAAIPKAKMVVVFDNTIDETGEMVTEHLPDLIEKFTGNLRRTLERLHAGGMSTVHLVTDHGFLLLSQEAMEGLGHPDVPVAQAHYRSHRYAVLKAGVATDAVFRKTMPLNPDITLGFTRGIRTLVKADEYIHGGISLQECVIPHLVSEVSIAPVRVTVAVSVTTAQLTGGTVPVIVRCVAGGSQLSLGGLQPLIIRIWVETADGRQAAEPVELGVRPDADELRPAVYLKEGLGLVAGEELRLIVRDAETGEDLGGTMLRLLVDWD